MSVVLTSFCWGSLYHIIFTHVHTHTHRLTQTRHPTQPTAFEYSEYASIMDGSAFNKTNGKGKNKGDDKSGKRPSSVLPALWRLLQVMRKAKAMGGCYLCLGDVP